MSRLIIYSKQFDIKIYGYFYRYQYLFYLNNIFSLFTENKVIYKNFICFEKII